jgi:hypothetical protein
MFRCLAAKAAWWLGLVLACFVNAANATQTLYDNNCTGSGCHKVGTSMTDRTCTGCHYHAAHPNGNFTVDVTQFNLAATVDKSTYQVGDTITVTVSGGNRPDGGWVRAKLYDANGTALNSCDPASNFTDPSGPATCVLPITLTTRAQSGMSQLRVGVFVNKYEKTNGATPVFAQTQGGQTIDSTSPANHAEERVTTNSFTVTEPAPAPAPAGNTASASGGGSFDAFVLLAALFGAGRARRR